MTKKKEENKEEKKVVEIETKQEGFKVKALRTMTCLDGSQLLATQICFIKTQKEYDRLKADKREIFTDVK